MSTSAASAPSADPFQALDDSKITRFQIKTMFVSGMGFFTDAYDLFVIGIVVSLLKTQWNLTTTQVSWLNSATLLASAFGAIVFGRIADMLGRKRIYGYEVLILAVGAIASAFSPGYTFLIVCRIILGIGIGGDYPVSATIMSEYSGKQSRGRMVGLVFAMQGLGLIFGPLLASILLASGMSDNLVWRLLLAFGALPGLAVFYLRRQIHETPRFAMAGGAHEEAQAAISSATGTEVAVATGESKAKHFAGRVGRLPQDPQQQAVADLAPRYGWRLDAARFLLLRQYHLIARDPEADQSACHDPGQHVDPAGYFCCIRAARLRRGDTVAGQNGAQEHPDIGLHDDGALVPAHRPHPRGYDGRGPVPAPLRVQLLLHRVRAEHHDVHFPGGALPYRRAHHRSRHLGWGGQVGRVRGRVPVP